MSEHESFALRLSKLIEEKRISHAELGREVGVSGQAVGKWAKGGNIEYDNLQALAKCLGVNWIWLRYGDDAMNAFTERRVGSRARREVIREIANSEERQRLALDMIGVGVWDLDLISDQLVMSAMAERLLGVSEPGFEGNKDGLMEYVHAEDRARVNAVLEPVLDGRVETFSVAYRLAFGEGRLQQRGRLLRDDVGRPVRVLAVLSRVAEDAASVITAL